jgi:hypothetical protein
MRQFSGALWWLKKFLVKKIKFLSIIFREIRDRVIFPYKIADEISKISIFIQTKNKFDENSTWRTFKYPNHEIQSKKVKSFSKIKKVRQLFRFSYRSAKTPKSRNEFASLNTWIWMLKFCRRYHNEPYYWLFAIKIGSDAIQTP